MLNPFTILAICIGPVIVLLIGWRFSKQTTKVGVFRFLDLNLLAVTFFVILSRIEGIILNWDKFANISWYLLPIDQPGDQLRFFSDWPWVFFRFWDGHFFFAEAISAFLLAWLIINLLSRQLRQDPLRYKLLKFGFIAHSVAFVPLAISSFVNGFNSGSFTINISLVFLICEILAAVTSSLLIHRSSQIWILAILVLQIIVLIIINLTASVPKENLLGINIVYTLTIIFNLIALIRNREIHDTAPPPTRVRQDPQNYRPRNYTAGRISYDIYR